jgi:outer membrane protein assembly factor BamE (lipoprotein component of BamABCDE complex)
MTRVVIISLLVWLPACVTEFGRRVDSACVRQIRAGITDRGFVAGCLGAPTVADRVGDTERWMYFYSRTDQGAQGLIPLVGEFLETSQVRTTRVVVAFRGDTVAQCSMIVSDSGVQRGYWSGDPTTHVAPCDAPAQRTIAPSP